MASEQVKAAGGVVWRKRGGASLPGDPARPSAVEVLVIHRPRYDDWTFPKGKCDPGEVPAVTAVREIREETGLKVRLCHPLPQQQYSVLDGPKTVDYWVARQLTKVEPQPFVPNEEVDELRWMSPDDARGLLSYVHDVALLDVFLGLVDKQAHRTRTLVVLRHATAGQRAEWVGDDAERPLDPYGGQRAADLVPVLRAYGVNRVVSSPALRCTQTVEPFARAINSFLEVDDRLGENTRPASVQRSVEVQLDRKRPVVLATHRPVLPWVFEAIGTPTHDLRCGEGVVVHHRKGVVVAVEPLS